MIAITGIHGNFYSNPFYYNISDTLNAGGIDFIYAQTCDAYGQIRTFNVKTKREELIGSWNERFSCAGEDIDAYLAFAEVEGYKHIILAGHSLDANKVIYYLSRHNDPRAERFFLLSPANLDHMMSGVTAAEKRIIRSQVLRGEGDAMLPFPLWAGWSTSPTPRGTGRFSGLLNNVRTSPDGDFSEAEKNTHTGAMLVGTWDNFTDGDPAEFLRNLNAHMPTAAQNKLIFIEKTGHTYQMKHQEVADKILGQIQEWRDA